MTAECDRTEIAAFDVGDLIDELTRTREQRDKCAAQIDALRGWSNRVN